MAQFSKVVQIGLDHLIVLGDLACLPQLFLLHSEYRCCLFAAYVCLYLHIPKISQSARKYGLAFLSFNSILTYQLMT